MQNKLGLLLAVDVEKQQKQQQQAAQFANRCIKIEHPVLRYVAIVTLFLLTSGFNFFLRIPSPRIPEQVGSVHI